MNAAIAPPSTETGYGFTVSFSGEADAADDLASFKRDVDILVEHGQEWVRFGIVGWEVVDSWGGAGEMEWNEAILERYDEAIEYANSRGLAVYLMTADGYMEPVAEDEYRAIMAEYWSVLAQRYAEQAVVWQLYNEVDAGHFRGWTVFDGTPSTAYLQELGRMLAVGRELLKEANPSIIITTNVTGYPLDDDTQDGWETFFDEVGEELDVMAIDVYPQTDVEEIDRLSDRVDQVAERYDKPVIVAEVGLQTCQECWTEEEQGEYVAAAVESLSEADPWAIIGYNWRDSPGDVGFGILHPDYAPKKGFDEIMGAMS